MSEIKTLEQIAAPYPISAAELAAVTGERREKFEAWMVELEAEHQKMRKPYGDKPIAELTGPVAWLTFFDEGFTPAEALAEDLSNADCEEDAEPPR